MQKGLFSVSLIKFLIDYFQKVDKGNVMKVHSPYDCKEPSNVQAFRLLPPSLQHYIRTVQHKIQAEIDEKMPVYSVPRASAQKQPTESTVALSNPFIVLVWRVILCLLTDYLTILLLLILLGSCSSVASMLACRIQGLIMIRLQPFKVVPASYLFLVVQICRGFSYFFGRHYQGFLWW